MSHIGHDVVATRQDILKRRAIVVEGAKLLSGRVDEQAMLMSAENSVADMHLLDRPQKITVSVDTQSEFNANSTLRREQDTFSPQAQAPEESSLI